MEENSEILVIDNGSGIIKAGFSGEDHPRCIFPNIVGIPKNNIHRSPLSIKDEYLG